MLDKDPGLYKLQQVQMMLRHRLGTVSCLEKAPQVVLSAPNDAKIAEDYINVIVFLRKKGQRKLLIQAMNEVRNQ